MTIVEELAELANIKAELRNFELNGSDAVRQIKGIYADLEITTNNNQAMKARCRKLSEALWRIGKAIQVGSRMVCQCGHYLKADGIECAGTERMEDCPGKMARQALLP